MTDRPYRRPVDPDQLGRYLRVLSVPTRILLLQKLQVPQLASEIRLPAHRKDERFDEGRLISRQAVEGHLAKLHEVGLVRTRAVRRGGRDLVLWHVDQARLYTLVDEMRRLSLLRTAAGALTAMTVGQTQETAEIGTVPDIPRGDALVLASGPSEGAAFALAGDGPWIIGRVRNENGIAVPHDPFVSNRNAIIHRNGGLHLSDLEGSRNGTTHNWRLLEDGETVPLCGGDTIGVGRTLLIFRKGSDGGA